MNCTPLCRTLRHLTGLTAALAMAGAVTLLLPGCGGGVPLAETAAATTAAPARQTSAATPASAEPADRGARTRQGRYLTRDQATALAHQLDDRVVTVEASCCGPDAADLDVLIAFGVQAAANLPGDTAFIVGGSDQRQAAAVVERLSAAGAAPVYLVTR